MTIKQQGGIFGRNPTFNDVTVDGILTVDQIAEKTAAAGITLDGVTLKDGNVVLADGNGIDFSATAGTGTSELFDDYEEGTWTPELIGGSGATGQTYTRTNGAYTKVGRQVTCTFEVELAAKGTVSGSALISGLPFTVGNSRRFRSGCPLGLVTNTGQSYVAVHGSVSETTNYCNIRVRLAAATSDSAPLADDFLTDTTKIFGSIFYFTD